MGMHASITASQVSAVTAIGSVTDSLKVVSKNTNTQKMTAQLNEFQREMERANVREEIMDDVLSNAFDDGVEEEADEITNQVLAELGVEMDAQMAGLEAPSKLQATAGEEAVLDDVLPDLRARLDAL